jgi:hypothetical protein
MSVHKYFSSITTNMSHSINRWRTEMQHEQQHVNMYHHHAHTIINKWEYNSGNIGN